MHVQGEQIVIFGDSLSHPGADNGPTVIDLQPNDQTINSAAPGAVLAAHLLSGTDNQRARSVRINARVGRSARSFLANEDAGNLLASDRAFRPTKVVIMLGTNDIDLGVTPTALSQTKNAMLQIRDAYRAMGAEVFAIGPPSFSNVRLARDAPAMLTVMQDVFGTDHTLDARPLTLGVGRSGDGVHFTQAGAAIAGEQLAQAITSATPPAVASISKGTKVALGALGVVGFVGLSVLALRLAKHAAQPTPPGHRVLGATDVRLIKRVAQMISYDVPKYDIREQLVDEGYSDDDIFQAHQAAQVYLRRRNKPDADFGARRRTMT